jgi:Skp family chaperone for outer membrane proteins
LARASKLGLVLAFMAAFAVSSARAEDAKPATAAPAPAATAPAAAPASATKIPAIGKIAVVDLQYLVSNSKAGKSIRDQLDVQRKAYGAQIETQEKELRAAEKDLMAQKDKLSKEEMQTKGKAFQQKVQDAQREVQQHRVSFDKAYTGAMEKLRENIVKIVTDLAGKNDVMMVLDRQQVVLVDAKLDLTKDVLAGLDAKITSIPVSIK